MLLQRRLVCRVLPIALNSIRESVRVKLLSAMWRRNPPFGNDRCLCPEQQHRLFLLLLFLLRRWGIFENDDGQIREHWDISEFWVDSTFDMSSGFLSGRISTFPKRIWSISRTNNCRMIWERFFLWRCLTVCDAFFSFVEHRNEWLDRRRVLVLIDKSDCLRLNSFAYRYLHCSLKHDPSSFSSTIPSKRAVEKWGRVDQRNALSFSFFEMRKVFRMAKRIVGRCFDRWKLKYVGTLDWSLDWPCSIEMWKEFSSAFSFQWNPFLTRQEQFQRRVVLILFISLFSVWSSRIDWGTSGRLILFLCTWSLFVIVLNLFSSLLLDSLSYKINIRLGRFSPEIDAGIVR